MNIHPIVQIIAFANLLAFVKHHFRFMLSLPKLFEKIVSATFLRLKLLGDFYGAGKYHITHGKC